MANSNGKRARKQSGLNRHELKGRAAKKRENKVFVDTKKTN
jgi:hypothetical protein